MLTNARPNLSFDGVEFERALRAADFDRCRELVDGQRTTEALLASSRLAMRERRYLDVIGLLADFADARPSAGSSAT